MINGNFTAVDIGAEFHPKCFANGNEPMKIMNSSMKYVSITNVH